MYTKDRDSAGTDEKVTNKENWRIKRWWIRRILLRGESKPEHRSGKRIIAGTAFRSEFLVGWCYDVDATTAVPELY